MFDSTHRRRNPLTGEWVLVSPHRTARPWQGQVEDAAVPRLAAHDPGCYLCPGNERAGGQRTPRYDGTFVFDNDFAALTPDVPAAATDRSGLLVAESERGVCRVICYSPRHDLALGQLPEDRIRGVVDTWADQYTELGGLDWVDWVQVFENRGAAMGASNPHPHGQIWAQERLPTEAVRELATQQAAAEAGGCLLCDYLAVEEADGERVVFRDEHVTVLVPFWAVWPFETLVLPRAHCGAVPDLDGARRDALAGALGRLARCYDGLFGVPFPYTMGLHQRPTDGQEHPGWHLHGHFYPPLLRSATVRKFMVGYEMLAQPQRDLTPESAAERLREVTA